MTGRIVGILLNQVDEYGFILISIYIFPFLALYISQTHLPLDRLFLISYILTHSTMLLFEFVTNI